MAEDKRIIIVRGWAESGPFRLKLNGRPRLMPLGTPVEVSADELRLIEGVQPSVIFEEVKPAIEPITTTGTDRSETEKPAKPSAGSDETQPNEPKVTLTLTPPAIEPDHKE